MDSPDLLLIDDRLAGDLSTPVGSEWRLFTDRVMGGVSTGRLAPDHHLGRSCLHLQGQVSLDNNGGFVQASLELPPRIAAAATDYRGVQLDICGDGNTSNLHLRSVDCRRPWQSYRASFQADSEWQTLRLPFGDFRAYRIDTPLRPDRLRRLGVVAIGREFAPDLWLGPLALYR